MLARLMVHAGHAADEEAAVEKLERLFARRFPGRSFDDFDTLVSPEMVRRYVLSLGLPEATTRPGLI